MAEKTPKLTPMFEQYLRIKADYPDALLFYRMGDFYELFFDDAVTAARELQIALTSRSRDTENPVPMCGVPWHAAQAYIAQLIDKGFHVAICDQTEDPKAAKGLVQRAVTCVVTPGTVLEDANLDARSMRLNFELNMEIFDPEFHTAMALHMDMTIARSREVTLKDLQERLLILKLRDAACWLFSPYL